MTRSTASQLYRVTCLIIVVVSVLMANLLATVQPVDGWNVLAVVFFGGIAIQNGLDAWRGLK